MNSILKKIQISTCFAVLLSQCSNCIADYVASDRNDDFSWSNTNTSSYVSYYSDGTRTNVSADEAITSQKFPESYNRESPLFDFAKNDLAKRSVVMMPSVILPEAVSNTDDYFPHYNYIRVLNKPAATKRS